MEKIRLEDREEIIQLFTNAMVRRYLGGPTDEQAVCLQFSEMMRPKGLSRHWAVRLGNDKAMVGVITIGPHHDGEDLEISYQFLPVFWGQGYASEAVHAVVRHALDHLGLPRIIAETQTANISSCLLLERIGMHRERIVKRFGAEQVIYTT